MKIYFDKQNIRLIYVRKTTASNFQDAHWNHWNMESFKDNLKNRKNDRFLKTFSKYIPNIHIIELDIINIKR